MITPIISWFFSTSANQVHDANVSRAYTVLRVEHVCTMCVSMMNVGMKGDCRQNAQLNSPIFTHTCFSWWLAEVAQEQCSHSVCAFSCVTDSGFEKESVLFRTWKPCKSAGAFSLQPGMDRLDSSSLTMTTATPSFNNIRHCLSSDILGVNKINFVSRNSWKPPTSSVEVAMFQYCHKIRNGRAQWNTYWRQSWNLSWTNFSSFRLGRRSQTWPNC